MKGHTCTSAYKSHHIGQPKQKYGQAQSRMHSYISRGRFTGRLSTAIYSLQYFEQYIISLVQQFMRAHGTFFWFDDRYTVLAALPDGHAYYARQGTLH